MSVVGMKPLHKGMALLMLTGLPLAGIRLTGGDAAAYLEFPPQTRFVTHAPFSWPVFIGMAAAILATVLPFLYRIATANAHRLIGGAESSPPGQTDFGEFSRAASASRIKRFLPWWGWIGLGLTAHFWILAWTRQSWFAPYQPYTFTPLWLGYIIVMNALTWKRTGRCLLTHDTAYLLKLFPLSAAFWWFFEYLNRFVQNWWYILGAEFTPLQYFLAATLPFSTVLPAVLSTEEWLAAHPRCTAGLDRFVQLRIPQPQAAAWTVLALSCAGLLFIGRFPDQLFPLLWLAPLLLLAAAGAVAGRPAFFPEAANGDWRRIFRFALAALICGFFWEMWNLHSLAKWIYSIPYVERCHLFEMPVLGYAGYLPFGLECAVIAELFIKHHK